MLFCSTSFQPTALRREIERYDSSTRPSLVDTEAGPAILKAANNPAGPSAIASEIVCAELGKWFGLRIPDFCVLDEINLQLPLGNTGLFFKTPVFASKYHIAETRDVSGRMLEKLENVQDISKLVIFDTLVRNYDRYDSLYEHHNSDNYLLKQLGNTAKYELLVIDHSHCISLDSLNDINDWTDLTEDETIYGLFPEFRPYVTNLHVTNALEKLSELDSGHVGEIVNSIPLGLGINSSSRESLRNFICDRADFLVANFSERIFAQLDLQYDE